MASCHLLPSPLPSRSVGSSTHVSSAQWGCLVVLGCFFFLLFIFLEIKTWSRNAFDFGNRFPRGNERKADKTILYCLSGSGLCCAISPLPWPGLPSPSAIVSLLYCSSSGSSSQGALLLSSGTFDTCVAKANLSYFFLYLPMFFSEPLAFEALAAGRAENEEGGGEIEGIHVRVDMGTRAHHGGQDGSFPTQKPQCHWKGISMANMACIS